MIHLRKSNLLTIVLLISIGIKAQMIPVYSEHFKSYDNVWKQYNNETGMLSVTESKYIISCKMSSDQSIYTVENKKIDMEQDFSIESAIIHTAGNESQFYGISYGYKDDENNFAFCITADGNYKLTKNVNGESTKLLCGSASTFIKDSGNEFNTLKIEKIGDDCLFYLNDSLLNRCKFEAFFGQNIGFVVSGNQTIEVDYLNFSVAITNPVKGIEIPSYMSLTLNENFNDETNTWNKANCSAGWFKIDQGKAKLKSSAIGHCCNVYLRPYIEQQNDFIIEVEIRKTDGSDESSFGILCGLEGMESSFQWLIQSSGKFGYYLDYAGDPDDTPEINMYNAPNKLTIYKTNNDVVFYINGKQVYNSTYETGMFDLVGFFACDPVSFEIEGIQIWQTKP